MKKSINTQLAKIAILWARGLTIEVIANSLFMPENTAASYLRRARLALGTDYVPPGEKRATNKRAPSALDQLDQGHPIRVLKAEAGGRQNVYQNADTRGWKVSVSEDGDAWLVTPLERVAPRARQRKARGLA